MREERTLVSDFGHPCKSPSKFYQIDIDIHFLVLKYAFSNFMPFLTQKRAILGRNKGPCPEDHSGTLRNEKFTSKYPRVPIFRAVSPL